MSVVDCRGLTKTYGKARALDNLSLVIEPGKITGIIGRNGAGKTTLLKLIAGFFKASAGEVRVFGDVPFNNLRVSANSIFIDDAMSFPPSLYLEDIFDMAARLYANWNMGLARTLLDYFSLSPKQCYARLSRGQQSTINSIRGLAARCPLTIFDEPTLGLDAGARIDFWRALLKDYMLHPRSILLSSHMLQEVEDVLEDIVLLKGGRMLLHVPLTELKAYALGLAGNTRALAAVAKNCDVIYARHIGDDYAYWVVKSNLTEQELHKAKLAGVDITAVAAADLCLYLTSPKKGGIDDVFDESKFA